MAGRIPTLFYLSPSFTTEWEVRPKKHNTLPKKPLEILAATGIVTPLKAWQEYKGYHDAAWPTVSYYYRHSNIYFRTIGLIAEPLLNVIDYLNDLVDEYYPFCHLLKLHDPPQNYILGKVGLPYPMKIAVEYWSEESKFFLVECLRLLQSTGEYTLRIASYPLSKEAHDRRLLYIDCAPMYYGYGKAFSLEECPDEWRVAMEGDTILNWNMPNGYVYFKGQVPEGWQKLRLKPPLELTPLSTKPLIEKKNKRKVYWDNLKKGLYKEDRVVAIPVVEYEDYHFNYKTGGVMSVKVADILEEVPPYARLVILDTDRYYYSLCQKITIRKPPGGWHGAIKPYPSRKAYNKKKKIPPQNH